MKSLLPLICLLILCSAGCHKRDFSKFDCKATGNPAVTKSSQANGRCLVDFDAENASINAPQHRPIGLKGDPDPNQRDVVKFHVSGGHKLTYCVRPNPGGSDQPSTPEPNDKCEIGPTTETGCNLYPFVDPNTGDPNATHQMANHMPDLLPAGASVCNYKLTFRIYDNRGTLLNTIDPHIAVGR